MDNRIPLSNPNIVPVVSTQRPTPTPVRIPFANVLAAAGRAVVSGAESAVGMLPGGPMMAVAIRNGSGMSTSIPMGFNGGAGGTGSGAGMSMTAEGPRAGSSGVSGGMPGTGGPGAPGGGGIESSLQQAQEMNLYYLQIQQEVQQQNQTFSTLSNVMKAEHDTVKNAIGNIR